MAPCLCDIWKWNSITIKINLVEYNKEIVKNDVGEWKPVLLSYNDIDVHEARHEISNSRQQGSDVLCRGEQASSNIRTSKPD